MISVIFHNLRGYDLHLIMKYVTREYVPNSIDVIPTTSEKFLSFQIGNLRFLDSLKFLTAFLDTLVQSLARMAEINLAIPRGITRTLIRFSPRGITLTNTWMEETNFYWPSCLPSTLSTAYFPKKLSLRKSTNELRKCGENSKIKNMQQHHELYLNLDVLLLAEFFFKF